MVKEQIEKFYINNMTCSGCEAKIQQGLESLDGIIKVNAKYGKGNVTVTFDESKMDSLKLKKAIKKLGYNVVNKSKEVRRNQNINYVQIAIISSFVIGIYFLVGHLGLLDFFNYFPQITSGMSYITIFLIGMFSSVHCIGMCGGICISQGINTKADNIKSRVRPALLYNLGRIVSYTVIGGAVGALGSIVSFNGVMRGAVAVFAGVFMIIMGLNMLNIFPWLRNFNFKLPKVLTNITKGKRNNSSFYIGLINGFMPCGPLQAMQLYALSTGSWFKGAFSMFLFSLGTSFLMFGFGALSSMLSKKFTTKIMAVSAILVVVMGVSMFNTGLSQAGFLAIGTEVSNSNLNFEPVIENGYQIVTAEVSSRRYSPIVVKKDIPAKINFYVEDKNINGCNNFILIPEFDIKIPLKAGDNIVEFTPTEEGIVPYSCWMNMIRSSITIVD